MTDSTDLLL